MCVQSAAIPPVPALTAQVAQAAFRHGTLAMRVRDEWNSIYTDDLFVSLFSTRGQPAIAPWRLALVLVLQFVEGLSDRQAADAVRGRIDWKYALSLDLTDPGFDFSVLSEFRDRLLQSNQAEQLLLDTLLQCCKDRGLLKARSMQRTDSTHVLAAVRALNRTELVGETLRATLNSLAVVAPDWVRAHARPEWFDRYQHRVEDYRLPKGEAARRAHAEQVGQDGAVLLGAIYHVDAPSWLRYIPAVETLRRTWVYQYYVVDNVLRWRKAEDLPPAGTRWDSPYDCEARYGNKRTTTWTGYKVHVTETCDDDVPHLITHVETTLASVTDNVMTAPIHRALADKTLLPATHVVDAGYVDAQLLLESASTHQITLFGPVRPNSSWQAQEEYGYDVDHFTIDWQHQTVTCPQGITARQWSSGQDHWGNAVIHVKFPRKACRECAQRPHCTRAKTEPREVTLRAQAEHEVLRQARQQQTTPAWKEQYAVRAGVEGTLSQGVRAFGLRKTRYVGRAKTQLQHILTAAAINISRLDAWLNERPHATTRISRFQALRPVTTATVA